MDTPRIDPQAPFAPSFTGGRQEKQWILQSLGDFYEEQWITDVLYRVKGGKEATVYCCRAGPGTGHDLIAAKIFRPRMFRAMRNDALYKEGRSMLDASGKVLRKSRDLRALRTRSRYGRWLDTASWVNHENRMLQDLYADGADVPQPLAVSSNALLMEFVGDETQGAPILHGIGMEPVEAQATLDRLIENVSLMLARYVVHADLSAYNVLYWEGDVRIIDFPQAVDALRHPQAFDLFARDVDHLCSYFQRQGLELDPFGLALDLWQTHVT